MHNNTLINIRPICNYSTPLQPIHLFQKSAVRLIAGVHYLSRTSPTRLFESFGRPILTVFDLSKLQLGVLCTIIKDASCLVHWMTTSVQTHLFTIILLDPILDFITMSNVNRGIYLVWKGPSIKYVTLFLPNLDFLPLVTLCHTSWDPPTVRHTSRTPIFSRPITKNPDKTPCTNSLSIVLGGFSGGL